MAQAVEVTTEMVLGLFRPVHDKIREALEGLDEEALSWQPGAETNAIEALIRHIAATERGNIARIQGVATPSFAWDPSERLAKVGLHALLAEADRFLDEMSAAIPSSGLGVEVVHPHRGPSSALMLLLQTYGHVYEHYGHLELTRQLYLQRAGS